MKERSLPWWAVLVLAAVLTAGCTTTTVANKKPIDTEKVVDNRLQLALGYMSKGDHERAREHLNKATEINHRSAKLHDVWALLYQREMEFTEAEKHYKQALSYDPSFTRGRNNYGVFLLRQNRYDDAYQQFYKGTQDLGYPKRAEMFYKMGIAALKLEKHTEAETAFTRAAVLNPQFSTAYLELAEIAYTNGDYPKSKQLLTKYNATKSRPTPKGLWLGVRLDHHLGDLDAEASQGLALRNLFPDSPENQAYQNWLKDEQEN